MLKTTTKLIVLLVCISFYRGILQAQATYAPTATSCLIPAHDSKSYNWVGYENNCTDTLNVTWVSRNGKNGGGLTIPSGKIRNTGFSDSEIDTNGGIEAYACTEHYIPVDVKDRQITKPVRAFRCKYRGY